MIPTVDLRTRVNNLSLSSERRHDADMLPDWNRDESRHVTRYLGPLRHGDPSEPSRC